MTLAIDWDVKHKTKQTFDISAAIKVSPTAELLPNRGVIYQVSITLLGSYKSQPHSRITRKQRGHISSKYNAPWLL